MKNSDNNIFELTPRRKLIIFSAGMVAAMLIGVVFVGRSEFSSLIFRQASSPILGTILMVLGIVSVLFCHLLVVRQIRILTTPEISDSAGKIVEKDKGIHIGNRRFKPVLFIFTLLLSGAFLVGVGFIITFSELWAYTIAIFLITSVFAVLGVKMFLTSVKKRRTSRKIGVSFAFVCAVVVLIFLFRLIPAVGDIISGAELIPVTGEVVSISENTHKLSSPGAVNIEIKSTSGEEISIKAPVSAGNLEVGKRYTFYYLPKTKISEKWSDEKPSPIDSVTDTATANDTN
ncbi:MAG: hypothetical protein LBL82_01965 [Oscillospiraceae bacterium]|jgi:hypothetical protein|nr:hypothetical protein [Oscillospiraceae bacterium]